MSKKTKTSNRKFSTQRSSSASKAVDWQAVLKDLDFIRKKVDEACEEEERPVINVRKMYGERSIDTIHDLYSQVLELYRQNNLLREEIKKIQTELIMERRKREEAEMNLVVLREENRRMHSEFIRSTTPVKMGRVAVTSSRMTPATPTETTIQERIKDNLVVFKKEPQVDLNEEFEQLLKMSSRQRNPTTKTKIRRELLRVTEQIKKIAKMDHSFL